MDLREIRKLIDRLDNELLAVLNRRMEYVVRARNFKDNIEEPSREEEVLAAIERASRGLIVPEFSKRLYQAIIEESKRLQGMPSRLIGFQGEHGAYSEIALHVFAKEAVGMPHSSIPHMEFADVFEGVQSGALDFGIVPVENSIAGNVQQVDDLLLETELHVVGEVNLDIHHCLLSLQETDYRDIKAVYSHPQALAQCRGFITRNRLEAKASYDTAGAALMVAKERPGATAVIASKLAADIYRLQILKERIEDNPRNRTRFLVLAREASAEPGEKCSVVFTVPDVSGALSRVLAAFSEAEINLTRIGSRPLSKEPGVVAFYLDFVGTDRDPKISSVLKRVERETRTLRILGCYRQWSGTSE